MISGWRPQMLALLQEPRVQESTELSLRRPHVRPEKFNRSTLIKDGIIVEFAPQKTGTTQGNTTSAASNCILIPSYLETTKAT